MKIVPTSNVNPSFQGPKGANAIKGFAKNAQNIFRTAATTALIAASTQALSQEVYSDGYGNQFVLYKDYVDLKNEYQQAREEAIQAGEEIGAAMGQMMLQAKEETDEAKTKYFLGGAVVGALLSGIGVNLLKSKK